MIITTEPAEQTCNMSDIINMPSYAFLSLGVILEMHPGVITLESDNIDLPRVRTRPI